MKYLFAFFFIGLLSSCDLFVSKEKKTQELINQEIREIDWNAVDSYPLFENCDETLTKQGQLECFEQQVLTHCSRALKEVEFVLLEGADPSVRVDFLVDKDGKLSVLNIEKDPLIDDQMPEFDTHIRESLHNLPPLAPALKRGMPVKSKFRIPIVLESNEIVE